MLVVTRKLGESIRIGADVYVHLLELRGNQARIGIDAPRTTAIWRNELPSKGYCSLCNTYRDELVECEGLWICRADAPPPIPCLQPPMADKGQQPTA